jgi:hypothetical protein
VGGVLAAGESPSARRGPRAARPVTAAAVALLAGAGALALRARG